jgi:hypothetical protein
MMFDLVDSFCATGLSGVQVPAVGVVPVPSVVVVVEPDAVLVEPEVVFDAVVVGVEVVFTPFVFAAPELPLGVVDFASFVVAPLEDADEPFTFVVVEDLTDAPAWDALGVVVLGPWTFGVVDAPPRAGVACAGTPSSAKIIPTSPSHRVTVHMVILPTRLADAIAMPGRYKFVVMSSPLKTNDLLG